MTAGAEPSVLSKRQKRAAPVRAQGRRRKEHSRHRGNLPCDGAFVCLGSIPETGLFQGQVALDERGYILANETTATNLPGVFAAGDVRTKLLRGILTAAADGAAAAQQAERYIVENI